MAANLVLDDVAAVCGVPQDCLVISSVPRPEERWDVEALENCAHVVAPVPPSRQVDGVHIGEEIEYVRLSGEEIRWGGSRRRFGRGWSGRDARG